MSRALCAVLAALALALTGCTGKDGGPQLPSLPGGPKVVVSDQRAPSVTAKVGSIRVNQVARTGRNVAIGLTVATGEDKRRIGRYDLELTANTGQKVPMAPDTDRDIPARSEATATLQTTLPEDGVKELRLALGPDLKVTVPVPAEDGVTIWRPAALRQTGLKQEPHQSTQSSVVFDTIRSDGLVTEVTYHATVSDAGRLNVCAFNFQYDKCRIEEPDGTIHPLIGHTDEATGAGGRSQGTLRFLGELDPTNTRLTLSASIDTTGTGLDPMDVTLPTHAESPTQAAAGDLTRPSLTLPTPLTATDPSSGATITVSKVDVLADRVQLTARLKAGKNDIQLSEMSRSSILDSSTGNVLRMLAPASDAPLASGIEGDAVLVFQGAVPASVTELKAHVAFQGWDTPVTFTVPVPTANPSPPEATATLGQLEAAPATPEVTVTPAAPAPAPTGTATPTPAPAQLGIGDIRPLPVSSSVRLPNPGSWLARQGATPAPAQDPSSEANAQQSLKDLGAQRTPDGWVLTLPETVLFEYNKYDVLPGADAKLADVATLLGHFPTAEIRVQGHTDSTGNADGNMTLSKNRADAVAKALSGKGVTASRMTVEGFAATRPVASNATDDGKAKNRRVEIVLKEKG